MALPTKAPVADYVWDHDGRDMPIWTLTRRECLDLLAGVSLGRVVGTVGGLPVVFPVHFALDGDSVVFGAEDESLLTTSTTGAIVGFQADTYNARERTGWNVLGAGRGSRIFNPRSGFSQRFATLEPWTLGERGDHLLRVDLTRLEGTLVDGSGF